MTEREQWRFQWPDGTWIRWNPQTQSWEKEDDSPEAQAEVAGGEPAAAATPMPTEVQEPVAPNGEPGGPPVVEEPVTEPPAEEPPPPEAPAIEPSRVRRSRVDDVLPGRTEPERPGGSWWPTIIVAVIVGLAVGLVLSSIIR